MNEDLIQFESIHEKVYERLRRHISQMKMVPGEKFTIRQIASAFGVSTMPVREALRQLQAEGLVTYDRRGVSVRQLSSKEVKEIFEIRERLEILSTTWALPNVRSEDEARFTNILEMMDRQSSNVTAWRTLNRQFHLDFYSLSGSQQLQQMIENLWVSVEPYMKLYTSTVSSLELAQRQHHQILELIRGRELEPLCTLTALHLQDTCKVVLENFSE